MNDLTLIIPAKDESDSLPHVLDSLKNLTCKVKVSLQIDDLATIDSINDKNIEIFYQSGKGYGNSLKEAINDCKTKYFCIFNADGSFEHKDLIKMYELIKENDFVYTTRYETGAGSEDDTIITYIGNKIFSFICKFFLRINLTDILYTFVLCNVESFNKLSLEKKDFRLCIELPSKVRFKNFSYCEVPMYERKRFAGKKNVNVIKDGFLILIEIIASFKYFFNKN